MFNQQANGYEQQWAGMAPIRNALYSLLGPLLADLADDASILCVGEGTGAELACLAGRFPGWQYTAVAPSGTMLDKCRARAEQAGFLSCCSFHEGYHDALPVQPVHDGATCFPASQFLLDRRARVALFHDIALRLKPGGHLAAADLASDTQSTEYETLLRVGCRLSLRSACTRTCSNVPERPTPRMWPSCPHNRSRQYSGGRLRYACSVLSGGIDAWVVCQSE